MAAEGEGDALSMANMQKELEAARAEIKRLNQELSTRSATRRSTDVLQSINEFRENLLKSIDWDNLPQPAAQLQLMMQRELVTPRKRQAFCVALPFASLPIAHLLTLFLAWVAIFHDSTRLVAVAMVLYFGHIYLDGSVEAGGKPRQWLKNLFVWKHMADYFPAELRKMNPKTPFPPDRAYLFGYHPHGIISVGCFLNFATFGTGCQEAFPGLDFRLATLGFNLSVPFFREWLLRCGIISVSARSIRNMLKRGAGSSVVIVPGGAAEAMHARPGASDLTLQRRNGFFRLALQHGVNLVPVYSFGENELYEVPQTTKLRFFQDLVLRWCGYSMPIYMGAGYMSTAAQNTPMNPVPRRHPIITIVGDPISCEQVDSPTQEQIDILKAEYIEQLKKIFDRFADQYMPSRDGGLRIVN